MTHRLTTNYAKNGCNRTLIVKVIVENVVTCFSGDTVYNAPKPIQGSSFTENKEKMFIQTSATRQELSAIPVGLLTQQFIDSHTKNEAWGYILVAIPVCWFPGNQS